MSVVLAVAAVSLVALGLGVLPDTDALRYASTDHPQPAAPPATQHGGSFRFVSGLRTADTVYVADGTEVSRGDTLALRVTDPHRLLREDLGALRGGGLSPTEAMATLEQVSRSVSDEKGLPTFLAELQREAASQSATPAPPSGIGQVDRDVLAAEVMGAEDALRDLRTKLRFIGSADSPDARQQADALRRSISEKEAFIAVARRRAAAPNPRERTWRLNPVPLTDEQKRRVENYAAALAPDSAYVLAPEAGVFRLHDAERPTRIERGRLVVDDDRDGRGVPEDVVLPVGGYELRARGLPELWSTAQRRDSVTQPSDQSLIVVPER